MNYKIIGHIIKIILLVEAVFMLPAIAYCLVDGDGTACVSFAVSIAIILAVVALLHFLCRGYSDKFFAKEGLITVGASWIFMSIFGALPFVFSSAIPNFIDAMFEIVSGFTTTGASILTDIEALPRGLLYWRSFSHWLGGMGVLVFILAIVPLSSKGSGYSMHLMRAESPGPDVGKLVPKVRSTAKILYIIYFGITALDVFFLMLGGISFFEAICTAFGTAGTGGFSVKNDSLMSFSPYIQNVCTVFMMLFGVNFSCYYLLIKGNFKSVLKDEEFRLYIGVAVASTVIITINTLSYYGTTGEAIHHAAFQVASIMTTTGFGTVDSDLWPALSKTVLLFLMFCGACAGSTGGGIKCGRVVLYLKMLRQRVAKALHPDRVKKITMNNQPVNSDVLSATGSYLIAYVLIIIVSTLLISVDNFSFETNFSAVMATFNNIGPGFGAVGAVCNYSGFSMFSKIILTIDMLAGRLEIFPILVLFSTQTWKND